MSTIHADTSAFGQPARASEQALTKSIASLPALAWNVLARLPSAFGNCVAAQRIARFSDHRLHDIGFERDWDGSVIPTQQ